MEEQNVQDQLRQIIPSAETIEPAAPLTTESQSIEYAGFWVRFAASLVDGLILIVPSIIISAIFGKNIGYFMQYILMWTYAIYMLSDRQATFGKMAVGIKVIAADGSDQRTGKLALREIVGKFLNIITFGIGYFMIAFTSKKQGLHDMIADTVVIYDSSKKRRPWITVLGIVLALFIPIMGIVAGIILVSTSAARNKALNSANEARQKAQTINTQLEKQN
jgi:uncharacterized RDD family membrane protein YckC